MVDRYIVYLHTCTVTGKGYVGYTISTIEKRWKNGKGYGSVMGLAIRKHGAECWTHQELSSHRVEAQAIKAESKFIRQLNTLSPNGYNILQTGITNPMRNPETRLKMTLARKGQYTPKQMAANQAKKGRPTPWMMGENNPMKNPIAQWKVSLARKGKPCPWLLGDKHHMRNPELAKAHSARIKGRITVNDGKISKCLPPPEAKILMSQGWVRGLLRE